MRRLLGSLGKKYLSVNDFEEIEHASKRSNSRRGVTDPWAASLHQTNQVRTFACALSTGTSAIAATATSAVTCEAVVS